MWIRDINGTAVNLDYLVSMHKVADQHRSGSFYVKGTWAREVGVGGFQQALLFQGNDAECEAFIEKYIKILSTKGESKPAVQRRRTKSS